jgi:hypothetical protein
VEAEGDFKVETHYSENSSACAKVVIVRGNINDNEGIVLEDTHKKQDEHQINAGSFIFHSPYIVLDYRSLWVMKSVRLVELMNYGLSEHLLLSVCLQFFLVQV